MLTTLLRAGGGTSGLTVTSGGGGPVVGSPIVRPVRGAKMSYKPGDPYCGEFTTARFDTGAATDADSLPVATANRNGADDGTFALTCARLDAGRYKVTGTVPSGYAAGDTVNVSVAATVNSVAGKGVIDSFVLDAKRLADVVDSSGLVRANALALGGVTTTVGDGTVAAADAGTITLDGTNDPYVKAGVVAQGNQFEIVAGTGAGATIYTLGTNVAGNQWNKSPAWSSGTPDTTSKYQYVGVLPGTGSGGLDAAGVRTAIGLASANLDTQLSAINAKTTNLPTQPAAVGSAMAIQDGAIGTTSFAAGATVPRVTLCDTLTTYTNNTPQTGDAYARIGANGSGLTQVTAATIADKAGYALSAAGLDAIPTTAAVGAGATFPQRMMAFFQRFLPAGSGKVVKDSAAGTIKTYADDGTTVLATQTIATTTTTDTLGAAS